MYWLLVEGLEASLIYIEKDSNSVITHCIGCWYSNSGCKEKKSYCMLCEVKKKRLRPYKRERNVMKRKHLLSFVNRMYAAE